MSHGLDGETFEKDNAEWRNAEKIFYHGLTFTLNLDVSYSNKDLVFLAIRAMTINFWVWQMSKCKTPMTSNHELRKTLPLLLS
jgi:hypothetical protein